MEESLKQVLIQHLNDNDAVNTLIEYVVLPPCLGCHEDYSIINCVICGASYCDSCRLELLPCSLCKENVCSSHFHDQLECGSRCIVCDQLVCPYCSHFCIMCGTKCYKCIQSKEKQDHECDVCQSFGYCSDCLSKCKLCGKMLCDECCYFHLCDKTNFNDIYCRICKEKDNKCDQCDQLI